MQFKQQFIPLIRSRRKTVTRRLGPKAAHAYRPGQALTIQPGRGKPHVGHIEIIRVTQEYLGRIQRLTVAEAVLEGFNSPDEMHHTWIEINGKWDELSVVTRIEFKYTGRGACCARN